MSRSRTRAGRFHKARRQRTAKSLDGTTPNLLSRAMAAVEREDAIVKFLTEPGPCALCGRATWLFATRIAHPPEAQLLGAAPGKSRTITSHLCEKCGESDGIARLERAMWKDIGVHRHAGESEP
jgi:hypothetical protein